MKKRIKMKKNIDILFCGDFTAKEQTLNLIKNNSSDEILEDAKEYLYNKDLSVINLECPLTNKNNPIHKAGPNNKMPPECVDFLKQCKFDIVNLANNHMGDYGAEGLFDTLQILNNNGFMHFGAGKNINDSKKPLNIAVKGVNFSFISCAENEFGIADENTPGVSPLNIPENIKLINLERKHVDNVIVLIHGGNEYNPVPNPHTVSNYRSFIDAGASAVIAMHPHCPQGYEIYNKGCIVYSLGNFLFTTLYERPKTWWFGYMAKLNFTNKGFNSIFLIPYSTAPSALKINILKNKDKDYFFEYIQILSDIIADDKELNNYWKAWCMMYGEEWLNDIHKYKPKNEDDNIKSLCAAMHRFTCESHNFLLKDFLKFKYLKVCNYEGYIEKIKGLQQYKIDKI